MFKNTCSFASGVRAIGAFCLCGDPKPICLFTWWRAYSIPFRYACFAFSSSLYTLGEKSVNLYLGEIEHGCGHNIFRLQCSFLSILTKNNGWCCFLKRGQCGVQMPWPPHLRGGGELWKMVLKFIDRLRSIALVMVLDWPSGTWHPAPGEAPSHWEEMELLRGYSWRPPMSLILACTHRARTCMRHASGGLFLASLEKHKPSTPRHLGMWHVNMALSFH